MIHPQQDKGTVFAPPPQNQQLELQILFQLQGLGMETGPATDFTKASQ
jgi:hypothetical protein